MDEGEFYDFLLYKYFRMNHGPNRYATTTKYLKKYAADGRLGEFYRIKENLFDFL